MSYDCESCPNHVIEVTTRLDGRVIDTAEAASPEAAIRCARTLWDEMFTGRRYAFGGEVEFRVNNNTWTRKERP